MELGQGFLKDTIKRFRNYRDLGERTLNQLDEQDLLVQQSEQANSIAMIIQHMHGNMLSRWTNFLTEDGEKEWRKRDEEFDAALRSKEEILRLWNEGWDKLLETLESLTPEDLTKTVTIRTEPLYVYDAILRQLAHYPYHVGQIVQIGKALRSDRWVALSIPKGGSLEYLEKVKKGEIKQP
ncbi:DUF1572 family protein [Sediminibacterium ginsengisoli]|uniref:DUF1572 domain-containing protein n=1 Tax=Sediminibacterium ginsengisoli TaxID=413434 RepID=A0A1T4QS16_9BACT|nr:DUF1572 family protein [Sediminibacterium ginsengisoli]SKA06495.1 Protein of unknown function [Sediminibacterium ginsengisoli]